MCDLDDVFHALHQSAKRCPAGISGLARKLGKVPKTLLGKLNPDDDTHQPTVGEFAAILQESGDLQPLEVFVSMFGCQLVTRTKAGHKTIVGAMLHSINVGADVSRAVEASLADDGVIDQVERARIKREISEARMALVELENTLNQMEVRRG